MSRREHIEAAKDMLIYGGGYDYLGICLSCGEITDCVEPDAEGYHCDQCEEMEVVGLELCLFM